MGRNAPLIHRGFSMQSFGALLRFATRMYRLSIVVFSMQSFGALLRFAARMHPTFSQQYSAENLWIVPLASSSFLLLPSALATVSISECVLLP
jgi:hypothetical protein